MQVCVRDCKGAAGVASFQWLSMAKPLERSNGGACRRNPEKPDPSEASGHARIENNSFFML